MTRISPLAALLALLILLLSPVITSSPITHSDTPDSIELGTLSRPPACTGNDGCVNYGHRRCGDPFASARCIKGFCCAPCRDTCYLGLMLEDG